MNIDAIKTIHTLCADGSELLVDIRIKNNLYAENELSIFSVSINPFSYKKSSFTIFTISTLELPSSFNEMPITELRETSFCSETGVGKALCPIQNLIIPDSIECIKEGTFADTCIYNIKWSSNCRCIPTQAFCKSFIKNLTNTANINKIGREAFRSCCDLESIESETMINCTSIGKGAFEKAARITEFTWPSKCKFIPPDCFSGCTHLVLLKNTSHIYRIGLNAFHNSGIKEFVLGEKCEALDGGCFSDCKSLASFTFNDKCQVIPVSCFSRCYNLTTIENLKNISEIWPNAFSHCTSLTTFNWPRTCSTIPDYCFYESGLEKIIIPEMIINFCDNAFDGTKIKEIDLSKSILGKITKDSFPERIIIKYPFYQ